MISVCVDILSFKEEGEEEWRQYIKADSVGFPLAAINRFTLAMSVNNVIYLRDYTKS